MVLTIDDHAYTARIESVAIAKQRTIIRANSLLIDHLTPIYQSLESFAYEN